MPDRSLAWSAPTAVAKTTSLRMLAGLLKPDAGSGRVMGFDLLRDATEIRRRVGYMSQAFSLYPSLSVLENLRFRADVFSVAKPRQAAERMLHSFGLEPFRHVHAQHLSGGWLRLLQLACALLHQPRLVLLDEPTAGLDALIASRYGCASWSSPMRGPA